jgi:hypothetical protein
MRRDRREVECAKRTLLCLILVASLIQPGRAQDASGETGLSELYEGRPRVRAFRLRDDETITVDGRIDEAAWGRAVPATDFVQQDPDLGEPATERTEVRFLLSSRSLYIGVVCYDSEPDQITANTMQRDASLDSDDRFMWTLDTYLDTRSAYYFEMNPNGAMGDALVLSTNDSGGGDEGRAWDGIWTGKVTTSEIGWMIEVEIPFRTLNFDPEAPAWGVNFQRTIRRNEEESLWTGWLRNQGLRRMSSSGLLEGITDVSQGVGLDVQPYLIGRYVDATGRDLGSRYEGDIGGDFIYNITPSLKSRFTVNTDFAETEVDQRRINLTQFPLFFPERRQFFLEGTTVFDFSTEPRSIRPFFSRRIGLDEDGQPQRVDYGVKVTGQLRGQDVGLIHVRTAQVGTTPGENFTVLRAKTKFFLESYAGVIYTLRSERGTDARDRHTAGVDLSLKTSRFRGNENLQFGAYYVWNNRNRDTPGGAIRGIRVDYPNQTWDARLSVREVQDGYDPAVGFQNRRGFRYYQPGLGFLPRPKNNRVVRNFWFEAVLRFTTDMDNRLLTRELDFRPFEVDFQSGDFIRFSISPIYDRLERDFRLAPGVTLPTGGAYSFTRYGVLVSTASRRPVAISTEYEVGTFYSGHRRDLTVNVTLRPRGGILMNLDNEWNRIELPEGSFSTHVLRLNLNTQVSPAVSLVNNVQYDSVSRVLGWQSRFRWIVNPGSDIYFVYVQNWLDTFEGKRVTLDRSATAKAIYTHRF